MKERCKIEMIHGDCMEYMARSADNAFSLAIVDPPYGIGDFRGSAGARKIHKKVKWNNEIPTENYFKELQRISKNRIIFGANYYGRYIDDVGRIVHDKTGGGKRSNPEGLSNCDIASHSFGVNMRIFHYLSLGNVIGNKVDWKNEMRWHPCQKPAVLYEWILKNYARPGDKILDTHGGSGSIALACWDMQFDLVWIEKDKEYFDAAVERLENHKKQLFLL